MPQDVSETGRVASGVRAERRRATVALITNNGKKKKKNGNNNDNNNNNNNKNNNNNNNNNNDNTNNGYIIVVTIGNTVYPLSAAPHNTVHFRTTCVEIEVVTKIVIERSFCLNTRGTSSGVQVHT